MNLIRQVRLDNGVRIAIDAMAGLNTASVGLHLDAGAQDDPAERMGLAHFLEHMAFKGARGMTARQIATLAEARGIELNAATGYERTSYYARCLGERAIETLDLLKALVFEADLPPAEIERERNVILQEIGEADDQPDDLVFQLAQAAAFGDHPLGRAILGQQDSVAAISAEDLSGFIAAHYRPEALVVSIAGGVDPDQVLAAARALFEGLVPSGPIAAPAEVPALMPPRKKALTVARKLEQCHLVLSRPAPGARDPARFAAQVFAEILGGGMASRLFQTVREDRGLVYAIEASYESYALTGRYSVYAGCRAEDSLSVAELTHAEWVDLATHGPRPEELARAKETLRAQTLMGRDAPGARAASAAYGLLVFGTVPETGDLLARLESVDSGAVRDAARAGLAGVPAASAVGPRAGLAAARAYTTF
jgi:predicted Zn-dependent peptidase